MCHALPDSGGTRARRKVRLALLQPGPCVLCAVADPSRTAPDPKEADVLAETGRRWAATVFPGASGQI
jgi:hypothetical protein